MNSLRLSAMALIVLLPATTIAAPTRYLGDDGANSPDTPYNRLGSGATGFGASGRSAAGSPRNLQSTIPPLPNIDGGGLGGGGGRGPIIYYGYQRDANDNIVQPLRVIQYSINPVPGSNPPVVIPTAKEWLHFLRDRLPRPDGLADVNYDGIPDTLQGTVTPLSSDPPKQTLTVVDQGVRQQRIDAGLPPETQQSRLVTVVTRWVEAVPQYTTRTVVGYPCCCDITFSLLTSYDYVVHVDTSVQSVNVADYPTTQIVVDRGVIVTGGNPQYSTQIPRLCEYTYGPGATFTAPVVPLITNVNDVMDLTHNSATVVNSVNQANANLTNLTNVIENGRVVSGVTQIIDWYTHQVDATQGNTSVAIAPTVNTLTEPMSTPLIPGSGPVGTNVGGVTLPANTNTLAVDPNQASNDRGTFTFPGDKAFISNTTLTRPAGSTNPADWHIK